MNAIVKFLNYWAGADNQLLRWCLPHERHKHANIGVLVLLTGIFASLAAAYAFWTVFESIPAAITLGFLWGLLIINLDRLMLATFPKSQSIWRQILHAIPRMVLAVLIGITIAHPITLRLFQPEILEIIHDERESQHARNEEKRKKAREHAQRETQLKRQALTEWVEVEQRKKEREEAAAELQRCQKERADAERNYLCEADGTCGSMKPTCGPICAEKKATYMVAVERCKQASYQVNQATVALTSAEQKLSEAARGLEESLQGQEKVINEEHQGRFRRLQSVQRNSFLTRSEALARIANEREHAATTRMAISLLLILVEVAAVLMKIIAPADSADKLAAAIRDSYDGRITDLAK